MEEQKRSERRKNRQKKIYYFKGMKTMYGGAPHKIKINAIKNTSFFFYYYSKKPY